LFQQNGTTGVWVIDNNVAKLVPVQVGGPAGNDILLTSGVTNGQTIVTAGVNSLKPGQKVSILGADLSNPNVVTASNSAPNQTSQLSFPALISEAKAGATAGGTAK
jgi:hypothetical protein